jgi:hypothetical protein
MYFFHPVCALCQPLTFGALAIVKDSRVGGSPPKWVKMLFLAVVLRISLLRVILFLEKERLRPGRCIWGRVRRYFAHEVCGHQRC